MKAKEIRSKKGITLVSLTIYIIVMLIVVSIVSTISLYFYNNVLNVDDDSQNLAEFNKFNMYFLEETKKAGNMVVSVETNGEGTSKKTSQIRFSNDEVYTFIKQDEAIYKGKARICENVKDCTFTTELVDGKEVVNVNLIIGNENEFNQTVEYVVSSSNAGTTETFKIGSYDDDKYDSKIENKQNTKFVFSPNGNSKYEKTLSTKISIQEGSTKIKTDTLKYIIKSDSTEPKENEFENANAFENGDEITEENRNGTYYVWAYGEDEKGNKIIQGSNPFKLDNTAPEITNIRATIGPVIRGTGSNISVNETVEGGSTVEIEVTGTDNSELSEIVYYIKEGNGDYTSSNIVGTTQISRTSITGVKNQEEITIPLADGTYTIKIELKDQAGNSSYIELTNIRVQTITEANYTVEHYTENLDGTYKLE